MAIFLVERRQTWDQWVDASIKIIKQRKGPLGGWIGQQISPWICSRKAGDSHSTLLNDGLIINLLCEQATQL